MDKLKEQFIPTIQRFCRLLFFPIIIASVISLMLPITVFADGSGDQYPSGATGKRAALEWREDKFAGLSRRTFFRVYVNANESILMGSSAIGVTSNADILVYSEDKISTSQIDISLLSSISPDFSCNSYRSSHTGAGVLDTRAKELAGPYSSTNTTGYIPCVYTAPTTGTYWVAIYGPVGPGVSDPTQLNGDVGSIAAPNITSAQKGGVSMWNITVRTSAGINKPGRVYVDYLAEYTGGNGADYQLYSTMYAATTDGYVYKVDTNGLDPQGFIFYGNRVGFYDPDGITPLYHDVVYPDNNLKTPYGGTKIAPATAKIFFTNPLNSDLPVSLLPTPVTPNINNVTFVGTASGVNGYYSQGGVFKYTGNVGGISEIIIQGPGQTDFDPTNTKNRRLLSEAVTGSNSITWDGNDNNGDPFPVGTNYAYKVILHAGEYHFPMIDSENSVYGGPTITMLNPAGGICPFGNCRTGFYDDRVYKVSTGTIVPTGKTIGDTLPGDSNSLNPPSTNHSDLTTGYDTSTNQRAYGNSTSSGFGNWKALDLWTYYPVEAVQSTLNVVAEVNSDLGIVKSHSGVFSVGGTGTFFITVSNVGTANINANKITTVTDTLPTGLTLTAKPTGTGWTCTGSAGATSFNCTRKDKLNTGISFPTITYSVNIGSTSGVNVVNTVTMTNDADSNSGNNTATDIITITSPDLSITKSDNVSQQATVGSSFNWTINVQNQGTAAANFSTGQTILSDTLPSGPTYGTPSISSTTNISNSSNIQCSTSSNVLTCIASGATVSFLGSGSSLTVTIQVTQNTAASLSNTATVDPNKVIAESNETNNSSTDVVTVAGSDIALTKTVSPTTAILEGGTLTYKVTATNNGPRAVTSVVVTDLLPTGLTLVNNLSSQGTYVSSTGVWTIGALANGASATLTITATANSGTGGTTLVNAAAITSSIPLDSNATNNSASVSTSVVSIDAVDDTGSAVNGIVGGTSWANVLINDKLNGSATDISKVTLTQTGTTNSGITLDETTGKVNVAAGTPFGSYTVTYKICDKSNPSFCDTAEVSVPVVVINAVNDDGYVVNGLVGGESWADVLTNDTLNGGSVTLSDVILTQQNTTNSGVTLDEATGKVNVTAGTPAGSYTVTYQICDKSNPTFCDEATVRVPVTAAEIVASDDTSATVNGTDGAVNVLNVLDNDTLNGTPVDLSKVTLSQTIADPSGALTLNPDGSVDVAVKTPAGSYSLTYKICENLNPTNCDTAVVTVPVAVIDAADDTGTAVNGYVGGQSLADVLTNDTLNGSPATLSDVNLSQSGTTNSGVTLDETTGTVNVVAGTPAGSYTVTYKICDKSNPTFCDSAEVSVLVTTPAINAFDDISTSAVNGTVGDSNVLNVFDNDTLNGMAVVPTQVALTTMTADPTGALTLNSDGSVSVAAGTSGGSYSLTYQICDKLNPTNCDTAIVTVPVVVIDAVNDPGDSVNGKAGGISESNVLANDTLNGTTATLRTVSLEQISSSNPNVSLNIGTAEVVVAPGTASGNYTLTYKICDLLNPGFCDEAEVTVLVTSSTILAVNDDYTSTPIAGKTGGDAGNALVNDTLNGVAVNIADINVSVVTPSDDPGVTLDAATGLVSVAAGTSGGEHTIDYRICEKLNPSNCSDATIKVLVNTYDLGLTMTLKTGQPDVVKAGDNVTYTITVKNAGNLTSGNPIVITDTLPTGMTLDDPNWTIGSGNTAVYTLTSDLTEAGSSSDTISIDIKLKVDSGYAGGSLSNFVEITTDQGDDVDSTPANGAQTPVEDDEASVDITAHNYGLGIAKTATESSFAIVGDLIHYSYVVTNGGDVDQNNVVVTDDKIDDDSANIDCDDTGSNVISVLKPGAANAVTCVATYAITEADVTAGLVTNTASVVSDETTTPVTTELTVPGLFDPITGIKVYDASKLPILTWTMTWINSSNDLPVAGHVSDPIPLGSTIHSVGAPSGYAVPSDAPAGSSNLGVSCTTPAGSTTTTSLCYYRGPETGFPTGQIVWEGVIGGDKGHIDTKTSKNQIVISFSTNIPDGTIVSANVAEMSSDLNSDGDYDDPGEENSATAISTWTEHTASTSTASVAGLPLPITGFAPNIETPILAQPFNLQYETLASNGVTLDVPSLGLKGLQIVGVPQTSNGWDVQWLDKNIGYLDGTAFPTWKGNSVLTGHVYLSNGLPGPFVNLSKLKYGDKVVLHAWGQTYTYEVRETETIDPSDSKEVLKHEDLSWITLLTCKDYNEKSKVYLSRFMARAVLISVK